MPRLSRRTVLKTAAATGAVGAVTGCQGGSGGRCSDDDASFEPTVSSDPDADVGPFDPDDEWPMYRNDAASTGYTTAAGPETNVVRAWRAEPASSGGSDTWAARSNNRVFVSATGSSVLTALAPADRAVVWRYEGLESATVPAIDDDVIVVGGANGLHAVDAEAGERRWRQTGERFVGSIIVADETAYANPDIAGDGVLAVDITSGAVIWRNDDLQLQHLGAVADDRLLVGDPLRALSAADGTELWRNEDIAAPGWIAVRDRTAYAVASPTIYAVDIMTGEQRWRYRGVNASYDRPAVGPSTVAVPVGFEEAGGGHLLALDRDSGTVRWCANLGERAVAPPVLSDATVYVAADELVQARTLTDGTVRWTATSDRGYNQLLLADETLFATSFGGRIEVFTER